MIIEIVIFPAILVTYGLGLCIASCVGRLSKLVSNYFRRSTTNSGANDDHIHP